MISSFYMHIVHVCSFGINRGCKYAAHMYSCNLKPEQHRITQSSVSISKFLYKKYSFVSACNRWDKLPWLNISIVMIYCNNEDKILRYKLLKAICNFEILNRIILKNFGSYGLLFYLVCLKICAESQTKQVGFMYT